MLNISGQYRDFYTLKPKLKVSEDILKGNTTIDQHFNAHYFKNINPNSYI